MVRRRMVSGHSWSVLTPNIDRHNCRSIRSTSSGELGEQCHLELIMVWISLACGRCVLPCHLPGRPWRCATSAPRVSGIYLISSRPHECDGMSFLMLCLCKHENRKNTQVEYIGITPRDPCSRCSACFRSCTDPCHFRRWFWKIYGELTHPFDPIDFPADSNNHFLTGPSSGYTHGSEPRRTRMVTAAQTGGQKTRP